eukprot:g13826.t1
MMLRGYDSQAFKASEEQLHRVWNLPDCSDVTKVAVENGTFPSSSLVWAEEKQRLTEKAYPENVGVAMELLFGKLLGDAAANGLEASQEILGRESTTCLFGVSALLFFYVRYLAEFEEDLDGAFVYFSLFDAFYAGSHPHLSEKGNWGFDGRDDLALSLLPANLLGAAGLTEAVDGVRLHTNRKLVVRSDDNMKDYAVSPSSPIVRKRLTPKIYVYSVVEVPTLFHHLAQAASFCGRGQWASEVHFHDWLMQNARLRTKNPQEADYFFVPGYAICIFDYFCENFK